MEVGAFVIALVLIAGAGLLAYGRMPFPVRGRRRDVDDDGIDPRTAEPPGRADDSG